MSTPLPRAHRADTLAYRLNGNCYLNITSRCTLRCAFCPKFNRHWSVRGIDLQLTRSPRVNEVLAAIDDVPLDREMVFCGLGEPTMNLPVLLAVARTLKRRGHRVRLNTDGLANLIHGRDVAAELAAVVDAVSVSLNAQNESLYIQHCRPKVQGAYNAVQSFSRLAKERGIDVTLTAIDGLPGVDIRACKAIADRIGVGFRRRELDVVG